MAHWLERYTSKDRGIWIDNVQRYDKWSCASDGYTLLMLCDDGRAYQESDSGVFSGEAKQLDLYAGVEAENLIECNLADLLRFAGYIKRQACRTCFFSDEDLCEWLLSLQPGQLSGACVDCYESNGWVAPKSPPEDGRKALISDVPVCMSRLAWSIPPELVEDGRRVVVGKASPLVKNKISSLMIDGGQWRIFIAQCDYVTPSAFMPVFYADPVFSRLWESARDDPAAMAALADWLEDRNDPYAEVLALAGIPLLQWGEVE